MSRWPILVAILLAGAIAARAQTPANLEPGAVRQHASETQQFHDLGKRLTEIDSLKASRDSERQTSTPENVAPARAGSSLRFAARRIVTSESEILSGEEIRSITAKYERADITIADLNRAVDELNHMYNQKGYFTARAILPPQQIKDGIVHIELVEGHVGKVSITTRTHTRDSYLLRGAGLRSGDLVQLDSLRKNLAITNLNNDVTVRAVLKPGADVGTTDIGLHVEEPEPLRSVLMFDNAGSETIGQQRVGVMERYSSLLGMRDPLTVGAFWATGTLQAFGTYTLPLTSHGTKLSFGFNYNHIRLRNGSLARFGISGDSWDASVKMSRRLLMRSRFLADLSLAPHLKRSNLEASGLPLTNARVRSLEMGAELQGMDHGGVWSANSTLSAGYHNLGGSNLFFKYNVSIARMQGIKGGVVALLRVNGQVNALNSLPPVEEIQVGGISSVRGYPEGRQIGDRGYSTSAELQFPLPFTRHDVAGKPLGSRLKAAAFVDHGAVFDSYNRKRPNHDDRYLTSVGFGLSVRISQYVSARVDVGVPLRNRAGISDVGVHYHLETTPPLAALWRWFRSGEGHVNVD